MPSLGGDQYKWYCEIPPLAEPGNYPGGVKTKPPFEMGVDDFDSGADGNFSLQGTYPFAGLEFPGSPIRLPDI